MMSLCCWEIYTLIPHSQKYKPSEIKPYKRAGYTNSMNVYLKKKL
jgi:hypothetical protein